MFHCEICKKGFESLDKHHIQSRSKGGSNHKCNIAYLCPNCHRLVHLGKVIIEGRFETSNGYMPVWRTYKKESITGIKDPDVYIIKKKK